MDNMDTINEHHFPDRLTLALVDLQNVLDADRLLDRHTVDGLSGVAVSMEVELGFVPIGCSSLLVADYHFDFYPIELVDDDGQGLPYCTWDLDPDDYIKVEPNSDELQDGFMLTQLQGIGWTLQAGWDA